MTPETETAPPVVGTSLRDSDATTTRGHETTSESSSTNGGVGRVQDSSGVRGGSPMMFHMRQALRPPSIHIIDSEIQGSGR